MSAAIAALLNGAMSPLPAIFRTISHGGQA